MINAKGMEEKFCSLALTEQERIDVLLRWEEAIYEMMYVPGYDDEETLAELANTVSYCLKKANVNEQTLKLPIRRDYS
jgi:hypothetical protein